MKNLTLTHASLALTAMIAVSLIYIAISSLEGRAFGRPLDVDVVEYKTTKDVYRPGELVEGYVTVCKKRNVDGQIQWNLIDTYLKMYPAKDVGITPQCLKDTVVPIEIIPLDAYPQKYHFEGYLSYKMNPFSEIHIPVVSNSFQVVR